jgi:hypothetical protein
MNRERRFGDGKLGWSVVNKNLFGTQTKQELKRNVKNISQNLPEIQKSSTGY